MQIRNYGTGWTSPKRTRSTVAHNAVQLTSRDESIVHIFGGVYHSACQFGPDCPQCSRAGWKGQCAGEPGGVAVWEVKPNEHPMTVFDMIHQETRDVCDAGISSPVVCLLLVLEAGDKFANPHRVGGWLFWLYGIRRTPIDE